jgi:hypothetical protein
MDTRHPSCSTPTAAAPRPGLGIVAAGMFGVVLFVTYSLQQTIGLPPMQTGFAGVTISPRRGA